MPKQSTGHELQPQDLLRLVGGLIIDELELVPGGA